MPSPRRHTTATRLLRPALALSLLAGAALVTAGCAKPLFPRDRARSQYESYDAVRNQAAPRYRFDEFGRSTPNLRGRLAPN